ncbi:AraC family transcriptional regulator [Paraburkholderia sp. SOS3]|jgi:AraC family transcriptional regulator|uniref:AraC family transcriptional regulator n=1 Tax=Paraburkholderia sp. SOS3 TaxID=1926494 RepID=UPI000947579B|nr:AraC family transcriptional regulator [Paraburkholderia sp. SOS3]APR37765.1 AraC family transcriptional regulator [Paraburkholderia sp. SOS3]
MIALSTHSTEIATDAVRRKNGNPIHSEHHWRYPVVDEARDSLPYGEMMVARWTRNDAGSFEASHQGHAGYHCIGLNLKCTTLNFEHAGRSIVSGRVTAGAVQVTAPAVPVSVRFDSPGDVLHLFVSQQALAECFEDLFGHAHAGDIVLADPRILRDPTLERLAQALAVSHSTDAASGKLFTDSVCLAIVSRLVSRYFTAAARQTREAAALPQWRMRRTIEFIEAHLSDSIGLAEMAQSAGLTRMHFAAQFRRATGLRPHEYLLRRRIEHAQQLLTRSKHSMLDVALSCGFRSQSHFTAVFKRFVGDTPYCWKVKTNVNQ